MRGENETIEDIEKKLRELARAIKHTLQMPQAMFERYATIENKQLDVYFAELADRIKAAHKREVDKLNSAIQATVSRSDAEIDRLRREIAELKRAGNAAKLREALVLALSLLDLKEGVPYKTVSQKDLDFMKDALAAPPRNCDVGRDTLSAALEQVNKVYDILSRPCVCLEEARQGCREARGVLIPALAAPPRNCDVGTADEQAERYLNHCESFIRKDGSKPCTGCPCCGVVKDGECEFAWAQLPYESEVQK